MSTDGDPSDDTRAKDMGAAELAELASWFNLPSFEQLSEQQARADDESSEEREWREARERRDNAAAAADLALVARLEEAATRPPPFKPLPPLELTLHERMLLPLVRRELDRRDHEDPLLVNSERPYPIPRDIAEAISEGNAPQAILRDLYRPETDYQLRFESPFDEPPVTDPQALVRQMLAEPRDVTWLTPPMNLLDEVRREFHDVLSAPWAELAAAAKAKREAGVAEMDALASQGR